MSDAEVSDAATKSARTSPKGKPGFRWSWLASLFTSIFTSWITSIIFLAVSTFAAYLALVALHVPAPISMLVVIGPCLFILMLMVRGIIGEWARYSKVMRFLRLAEAACGDDSDFSIKMREFRLICAANRAPEMEYVASKFILAINDLEPELYQTTSSKVVVLSNYINNHESFEATLPRLADQIVRISLLCTFAGIAYALIITAGQLEHIGSDGGDTNQSIALVRDLIHSASFKFVISAVGLLAVIALRSISIFMETNVSSRLGEIFAKFAERSSVFARARQHGGSVKGKAGDIDLPSLLQQLSNQLEQNIHMREAAANELAKGFQEAASSIQMDFSGRFNELLYERFSAIFSEMARDNRAVLNELVGVLGRLGNDSKDQARKRPRITIPEPQSSSDRPMAAPDYEI